MSERSIRYTLNGEDVVQTITDPSDPTLAPAPRTAAGRALWNGEFRLPIGEHGDALALAIRAIEAEATRDAGLDADLLEQAVKYELEVLWGEPTMPSFRKGLVKGIAAEYARLRGGAS